MTKYIGILFVAMTIYACGKLELKPLPPVANKVSISTNVVSSITHNSAVVGGTVNSTGEAAMLERGVCYATTQNPTVRNPKLKDASLGAGSFQLTLQGLTADTKYFVRAYTVSAKDTAYGENLDFTTSSLVPSITTNEVNNVTTANAIVVTNVTSIGAGPLTQRGVCWSTTTNPTIANDKSTDPLTLGNQNSKISGLKQNTRYYVRAFAANSFGITYGKELNFMTPLPTTEDLNQVKFINNNIGFIAGNRVILKTVNGGDTWIKIRESATIDFTCIHFENENLGYAGGNDQYYAYIFKTTDGGLTWVQVARDWNSNERLRVTGLICLGANRVSCLINSYPNISQVKGKILISGDGGANWSSLSVSKIAGFNCVDVNSSGVQYIGGSMFWSGSTYNVSVYTLPFLSNGSTTLTEKIIDGTTAIIGIDMNGNRGYAVGSEGKYFLSGDAGANWTMRSISGYTKETLNAVQFKDNQNGFIAGTNGLLLVSTDGGLSWFKEITNFTGEYTSIAIKPDGTVFAVGEKGEIFRK
jgi:photosystem II stability/assembly factor-like uncharacterized protein